MRIVGGKHRGRVLAEFKGREIRPTSDRAREALFNILAPAIAGAGVLDLFCGSGAVGLEALSRGAGRVVFNDVSKDSLAVLRKNLALLGERAEVYNLDFRMLLARDGEPFDFIFIDPPYKSGFGREALSLIAEKGMLAAGGVAVLESDAPFEGEICGLERTDARRYGIAHLTFFSRCEE